MRSHLYIGTVSWPLKQYMRECSEDDCSQVAQGHFAVRERRVEPGDCNTRYANAEDGVRVRVICRVREAASGSLDGGVNHEGLVWRQELGGEEESVAGFASKSE